MNVEAELRPRTGIGKQGRSEDMSSAEKRSVAEKIQGEEEGSDGKVNE